MLRQFFPKERVDNTYDIVWEEWYKKGIRGVIFDVDNTLVPHGKPADERAIKLFETLKALEIKVFLMSNNNKRRVESFAKQVQVPYIHNAGKPLVRNYKKAMDLMGTSRDETLFVGDQIFTDIFGANRAKIPSVLVSPIHPKEEIQIIIKRSLESAILHSYEKYKRRG